MSFKKRKKYKNLSNIGNNLKDSDPDSYEKLMKIKNAVVKNSPEQRKLLEAVKLRNKNKVKINRIELKKKSNNKKIFGKRVYLELKNIPIIDFNEDYLPHLKKNWNITYDGLLKQYFVYEKDYDSVLLAIKDRKKKIDKIVYNKENKNIKTNNNDRIIINDNKIECNILEEFANITITPGIESVPYVISNETKSKLETWIKLDVESKKISRDYNADLDAYIGFDFGTSSSKIIINFPYHHSKLGYKNIIFDVPKEFQSTNKENLWKSVIYINNNTGEFSLFPANSNYEEIKDIKISLINKKEKNLFNVNGENITAIGCAIAYISLLLKLVRGFTISKTMDQTSFWSMKKKLKEIKWSLHIGMPCDELEKENMENVYEDLLKKAWCLSYSQNIDITKVNNLLNININENPNLNYLLDRDVIPEINAAVNSLKESKKGFAYDKYILIDIGASTLDLNIFHYDLNDNVPKLNIYDTDVKLLGCESKNWIKEINNPNNDELEDLLKKTIFNTLNSIIAKDKKIRDPRYYLNLENKLNIILIGGGVHSKFYKSIIQMFINNKDLIKIDTKLIEIEHDNEKFENLSDHTDMNRLLVAYGLSQPETIDYTPSREIKDVNLDYKKREYRHAAEK